MENINIVPFLFNVGKNYGADIVWIIVLFLVAKFALKKIVHKVVRLTDDGDETQKSMMQKRAETISSIVIRIGRIVIYGIILLMVLKLLGVDITPILAGIGIMGLAVGFGAQTLVKDFVSGLFILVENQYSIGDKVKIGSFEGTVVRITIRSTVLRDDDGKRYYLSNGSIANVINLSQGQKPKQ